jgi:GMP synthase-like glutamine amidotransferase
VQARFKYQLKFHENMSRIAIIENSERLGSYFTKFLDEKDYEIFPVWKAPILPKRNFDSYLFTGDFNNISDGLLPIHRKEIEFTKSIQNKKIFGSCFFHQLIGMIFGGSVKKRDTRFFGWHKMTIIEHHQIFNGLKDSYFLNLNVDEIGKKPDTAHLLATNPECKFQVLQFGENILTCQSHPEIFLKEGLESIITYRENLIQRCPDLDNIVEQTSKYADDESNEIFLSNIIEWLLS